MLKGRKDYCLLTLCLLNLLTAGTAAACSVCTSSISYNMLRFTPVWLLALIGWVGTTWWIKRSLKPGNQAFADAQKYFVNGRRLLIVSLVLYLFGLHLAVVLLFPLILLKPAFMGKGNTPQANTGTNLVSLRRTARALLILLVLSAPLSYLILPHALTDIQVRVLANNMKQEIEHTASARGVPVTDRFAFTSFSVPVLNVLVQAIRFYRPNAADKPVQMIETASGTVALSRGPDGKLQLSASDINEIEETTNPLVLRLKAYDPTNGSISSGDLVIRP